MEAEIDEQSNIISTALVAGLRPVKRLTVSEWANAKRILTSQSSSEPGPYRYQRTPYLRQVMDYLGKTSDIQELIGMKGAQIGFTDAGNNWIGYTIDIDPGPMLLVMPTEGAIKKNSRTRIKPMIDGTPALSEKVKQAGSKDSSNTVTEKEFPGGVLMMVAAHSPVGLSSTPVGKIFLDEVDRYPASAGNEGSPVELARARARTFSNKKIFIISTPTNEGESIIAKEFADGDCQYYYVPCLHCDELFIITWECITWEEGKPETTRCACPNCGGLHEERHKTIMLAEEGYSEGGRAKWIATKVSSNPKKVSMHLSGLYSPAGFYSWEDAVRDYLKAENDDNLMRTWINTVKGETYKIKGDAPDFENLYNRREEYPQGTVPSEVCFLTMGADIQKDRIECEVVGWGRGKESWSIDYHVFLGDTTKPEVYDQLRQVINNHYPVEDGGLMQINMSAIDAGYNTSYVYDFTNTFSYSKVIPVMGRDSVKDVMVLQPKPITVNRGGKKIEGAKVWYLGTGLLKTEVYGFLKLKAIADEDGPDRYPAGYCHFPMYDRNYFKMLTAEEERMVVNKKGYTSYEWVKIRDRNEALDVRCYARAAANIIGMDRFKEETWEKVKEQSRVFAAAPVTAASNRPVKKNNKSDFWKRK